MSLYRPGLRRRRPGEGFDGFRDQCLFFFVGRIGDIDFSMAGGMRQRNVADIRVVRMDGQTADDGEIVGMLFLSFLPVAC